MNFVLLEGVLSRPSVARDLPSGSVLWALEVTTRDAEGAAASVPVSWFDPASPPDWDTGTPVIVFGTVRRRFFRAGGSTQSRTEVVAESVCVATDRRTASRLRRQARTAVAGDGAA